MKLKLITILGLVAILWAVQPGTVRAQNETKSQKELRKTKKRRMRDSQKAERNGKQRHLDIQSKDTRKRMKKHLKQTRNNIKRNQHPKGR